MYKIKLFVSEQLTSYCSHPNEEVLACQTSDEPTIISSSFKHLNWWHVCQELEIDMSSFG